MRVGLRAGFQVFSYIETLKDTLYGITLIVAGYSNRLRP